MATTTVKIPFGSGVYKNVDKIALTEHDEILENCYLDEMGYCNGRPGLGTLLAALPWGGYYVQSLYWWGVASATIIEDPILFVISAGGSPGLLYGSDVNDLSYAQGNATERLQAHTPVSFAHNESAVFCANGGHVLALNGSIILDPIPEGGSVPEASTHVAWMDTYLLANEVGTNTFKWSDPGTPYTWNALNFASATGDPDPIIALHVFQREIFLFGPSSFEVWQNDGTSPFSRVPGGFYQIGCSAPYSVIIHGQDIYWLTHKRRFVKYSNGQIINISTQYDKEITEMTSVEDCRASDIVINGRVFFLFAFKSEGRTLVFDVEQGRWHEWSTWDTATGEKRLWRGECAVWCPDWGVNAVGDNTDGYVWNMKDADYFDSGDPVRTKRRTAVIDHGSTKLKRSEEIRIRFKRGSVDLALDQYGNYITPSVRLRWKDDNKPWSNYHSLSLGQIGETDPVARLRRTGIYRTRQYELVMTDGVPLVYGDGEEDITFLR